LPCHGRVALSHLVIAASPERPVPLLRFIARMSRRVLGYGPDIMSTTEPIPFTYRFVASPDTGRRMARALIGHAHRMRRQWIVYLLILMLFTLIIVTGMDSSDSLRKRLFWAIVFALVPTVLVGVFFSVLGYFRVARSAQVRVFPGAVLESGFGEDALVLRNPMSESRISYQAIRSVTPRGDFIFMRQHGVSLISVFPRALFPGEAIERMPSRAE
jgi:hypothetical protein